MNNINNNLQRVKEFTEYLNYNVKVHTKIAKSKTSTDDDKYNSELFLNDYEEVLEKLAKVIDEYNEKTGSEY